MNVHTALATSPPQRIVRSTDESCARSYLHGRTTSIPNTADHPLAHTDPRRPPGTEITNPHPSSATILAGYAAAAEVYRLSHLIAAGLP